MTGIRRVLAVRPFVWSLRPLAALDLRPRLRPEGLNAERWTAPVERDEPDLDPELELDLVLAPDRAVDRLGGLVREPGRLDGFLAGLDLELVRFDGPERDDDLLVVADRVERCVEDFFERVDGFVRLALGRRAPVMHFLSCVLPAG